RPHPPSFPTRRSSDLSSAQNPPTPAIPNATILHPRHRRAAMRWTPGGDSQDIEDRRDQGGGGGGFQFGGMHIGIGGALVLLVLRSEEHTSELQSLAYL